MLCMDNKKETVFDKLKSINSDIRAKKLLPFYFLYGEEDYFINSIVNNIRKAFADESKLNTKIYDDDNFDIREALKYLEAMPILNDKKIIIFKDINIFKQKTNSDKSLEEMLKPPEKGKVSSNVEVLLRAFNNAKDINIVIVVENENNGKYTDKYTTQNKFIDYFNKNGVVFNLKKLYDSEVLKYLESYFKKYGKEIDKVNLALFIRTCGVKLLNLFSEADKLISYIGDKKKVDKVDIETVLSRNIDDSVYDLIDLINANKKNEAFVVYGDLIANGMDKRKIFNNLSYNYANLLVVKDLTEQSKSLKDICDIVGLADWQVRKMIDVNRGITKEYLNEKIKNLSKLSYDSMIGDMDQKLMIELIFN